MTSLMTNSRILPVVVAIAALTVGHLWTRWWVRRLAQRERAKRLATGRADLVGWVVRGFADMFTPAIVLAWIHAAYLTIVLLIAPTAFGEPGNIATVALTWVHRSSLLAGLVWLLSRLGRVIETALSSLATRSQMSWDDLLLPLAGKAVRRSLPILAFILGAPALSISPALTQVVRNATSVILIGVVAVILVEAVGTSATFILARYRLDTRDNLQARAVHTQVLVLKKVALAVIGIFTLASMLMVFEPVRQFGASILASAGIAGIVVGLAAQRTIATLLAGFQIALTQPIRVDDVVIIDGEWGRIEDISLTYVVVRIWDERRLIVPITRFIEQPFQNWTRSSSELLGAVTLHVDYTVPIEALRAELTRILRDSPKWDGRVNVLQVTEAKEHSLQIRALASAADSSSAWDLRCEVRERLVHFLQRAYPDALPRIRAVMVDTRSPGPPEDAATHSSRRPQPPQVPR